MTTIREGAASTASATKKSKGEDGAPTPTQHANGATTAADHATSSATTGTTHSDKLVHAFHGPLSVLSTGREQYLPGFAGEHQSEALPHALPIGQNNPQVSVQHGEHRCSSIVRSTNQF